MPTPAAGTKAPEISLHDVNGEHFSLTDELKRGPVVLAFFKISCPVCQYTFPFLERLYRAFHGKANIVGVSQNSQLDTSLFQREYGITFRTLLDEPERYPASNAFGLTNVPSVFLIAPDGSIELSSVGWSRDDIAELARRLGEMLHQPPPQVFRPGEDVPAYKAG